MTEFWLGDLSTHTVSTTLGRLNIYTGGRTDGPAMVFWPSLLVDSSMWRDQYTHFAPRFSIVLIDPPGAGASEPLRRTFDLAECCDCVIAVLDALHIERCQFVGTSWGALVGSVFAALHPHRLAGAVLINGSATPPAEAEIAQMTQMVGALEGLEVMPDWLVGATQAAFAGPTTEASNHAFLDYLQCVLNEDPKSMAFAARSVVIESKDRHDLLRRIRNVPVLVLAGEEDRCFSVEEARHMADAIPGSRLEILPHTGHLAARENPQAVNHKVDAFLKSQ